MNQGTLDLAQRAIKIGEGSSGHESCDIGQEVAERGIVYQPIDWLPESCGSPVRDDNGNAAQKRKTGADAFDDVDISSLLCRQNFRSSHGDQRDGILLSVL